MEAATLKKKSIGLSKGKLKKTIKNVLCRPDPINWPVISEENSRDLCASLRNYKVEVPEFKKLKWEVLKQIPKEERPKPPAVKKPDGLIFGIKQCSEAIASKDCSALLVDSEVNPKFLVQPIIETCLTANVPFICLKNLKELSLSNFGIKTACLGIKLGCLDEISNKITELAKKICAKPPKLIMNDEMQNNELSVKTTSEDNEMAESSNITEVKNYLLKRTSEKSRAFVPSSDTVTQEVKKKFIGQDFIEFSGKTNKESNSDVKNTEHTFKNMKLKRIANNPNRVQMGKKRKIENAK